MINNLDISAYVEQIKIEQNYNDFRLSEENLRIQALERCPNFLHKDGRIYGSKEGEKYFAVTVSPINVNFENQIESKIYPVVKCLLDKNYLTVSSCEGHNTNVFGDPPSIRIAFGSLESAERFKNFLKHEEYIKMVTLERSANVIQFFKNNKFQYESTSDMNSSYLEEAKDINRIFFRNYNRVWYVNIQLVKKLNLIEKIKDLIIPKKSENIRKELIEQFLEKIKLLPHYEL